MYLHDEIDASQEQILKTYAAAGFKGVFTSVNLPEDDPSLLLAHLQQLGQLCEQYELVLTVDVSAAALTRLGLALTDLSAFQQRHVTTLRMDDGITMADIATLTQTFHIALNASTITEADIQELTASHANFDHLEAWHNYYPRENTGLDRDWFKQKNHWLVDHGFTVMAFVAGDGERRGPVFAGLPTLEAHRYLHPLAAMLDMQQLNVTHIFIGDPTLSSTTLEQLTQYTQAGVVVLHAQLQQRPAYFDQVLHQRADVARDVIRLAEGRRLLKGHVEPATTTPRLVGAITLDNARAARYEGELEIVKRALPANATVNVIGQVVASDCDLLPFCSANQAIKIMATKGV